MKYKISFKKIMVVAMAFSLLAPAKIFAKSFKDVTINGPYGWVYESLDDVSNKNIFNGYPDGTFKPYRAVSFLEIMQVIRNIKSPTDEVLKFARDSYYSSIEAYNIPSWAVDSVCFNLYTNTITLNTLKSASERGFLRESNPVYPNRNSVSVYIARALMINPMEDDSVLKHRDVSSIPSLTKSYLSGLVKGGIFSENGSDGLFNGDKYIRRAEVAVLSKRAYDYYKNMPEDMKNNFIVDKVESNLSSSELVIENNLRQVEGIVNSINNLENGYEFRVNGESFFIDRNTRVNDSRGIYLGDVYSLMNKNIKLDIKDDKVVEITVME